MPDRTNDPGSRRGLPACPSDTPCPAGDSIRQQFADLQTRYETLLRCVEGQNVAISAIRNQIDQLYETVYTGNGEPSLLVQISRMIESGSGIRTAVADLHAAVSRMSSRFETNEGRIESRLTTLELDGSHNFRQFADEYQVATREAVKRNTAMLVAIVSVLFGVLGTLLTNYVQGFFKP